MRGAVLVAELVAEDHVVARMCLDREGEEPIWRERAPCGRNDRRQPCQIGEYVGRDDQVMTPAVARLVVQEPDEIAAAWSSHE